MSYHPSGFSNNLHQSQSQYNYSGFPGPPGQQNQQNQSQHSGFPGPPGQQNQPIQSQHSGFLGPAGQKNQQNQSQHSGFPGPPGQQNQPIQSQHLGFPGPPVQQNQPIQSQQQQQQHHQYQYQRQHYKQQSLHQRQQQSGYLPQPQSNQVQHPTSLGHNRQNFQGALRNSIGSSSGGSSLHGSPQVNNSPGDQNFVSPNLPQLNYNPGSHPGPKTPVYAPTLSPQEHLSPKSQPILNPVEELEAVAKRISEETKDNRKVPSPTDQFLKDLLNNSGSSSCNVKNTQEFFQNNFPESSLSQNHNHHQQKVGFNNSHNSSPRSSQQYSQVRNHHQQPQPNNPQNSHKSNTQPQLPTNVYVHQQPVPGIRSNLPHRPPSLGTGRGIGPPLSLRGPVRAPQAYPRGAVRPPQLYPRGAIRPPHVRPGTPVRPSQIRPGQSQFGSRGATLRGLCPPQNFQRLPSGHAHNNGVHIRGNSIPAAQKLPPNDHSSSIRQGIPAQQRSNASKDGGVVKLALIPDQVNPIEQNKAWERAVAFLKQEKSKAGRKSVGEESDSDKHKPHNLPTLNSSSQVSISRIPNPSLHTASDSNPSHSTNVPIKKEVENPLTSVKTERLSPVLYTSATTSALSTTSSSQTLSSKDYILPSNKSAIFDNLDQEVQSILSAQKSDSQLVKKEILSPHSDIVQERKKDLLLVDPAPDHQLAISDKSETSGGSSAAMSGQAPRLPPGISVQKSGASPAPRLPPGISMQRSSDSPQMPKLPSGIQVQRSSDSNMDRLAGLGIQVSRTVEDKPANKDLDRLSRLGLSVSSSSSQSDEAQSRLSGLGVSVSGGPKPANNVPKLPPGVSVSGGGQRPNLPPGISVSGGQKPNLPPGISVSGGQRPNLPPGISVSGGQRPNLPPGVSVSGGQKQNLPSGISVSGGPSPVKNLPPGVSVSGGPSPAKTQPPASKPPPNLPSGISLSGGPNQPPVAKPPPNLPAGINISGGPRPANNGGPRPANNGGPRPNLPPGVVSINSAGPRPVGSSPSPRPAQGNPPSVRMMAPPRPTLKAQQPPTSETTPKPAATESHTEDVPESCKESAEFDRSKSPAETLSDIDNFVKETNQDELSENGSNDKNTEEPENVNKDAETTQEESETSHEEPEPEKTLDENTSPAEESMELDENQEEGVDDNVEENAPTSEDQRSANNSSANQKSADNSSTENPTENGEIEKGSENVDNNDSDSKTVDSSEKGAEKESKDKSEAATNGVTGEEGEAGEGEENWEEYDGEEGWEGYEGEEGWEGYEGEEGYEEYEGEEGWEGYEEDEGEEKSKTDDDSTKTGDKEKDKDESSTEMSKSNNASDSEAKAKESTPSDSGENSNQETEDETMDEAMDFDDDGAPKQANEDKDDTASSSSAQSKDNEEKSVSKLPPGISISMSPVPSLPPGISISSPSGKGTTPNLPPGISISPFKKPSTSSRPSVDDDTRSQDSFSRDEDGFNDSVSMKSLKEGEAPEPLVGTETLCVFCLEKCTNTNPKLLTCLMSSCSRCFGHKIRESMRDNSANDVVDLDGNEVQMAPEVSCPVCKATTSEDEVMDNVFAATDAGEDDSADDDEQHVCYSCEENSLASSKCEDCDEYLCNDCVRAHQRVKMTKDHKISALQITGHSASLAHLNYCKIHPNEKLTLYCETCDMLNCRDCQLSERCRHHKYRYSYEVAPEVKAHLMQSVSDIRLKKSGLEESRQILSSKISDVNAKENSLIEQIREIKNYLVAKIENRHKELVTEISKICREKRKILEGRKSTLDRTFWQAEYGIKFVDHLLSSSSVSDEKILLTKKMMYRQMKRMRRANNAVGLTPAEMELKLDLYFQHFTSQSLHTNLDNVLKMVMNDIKVSQVPIEAPKPKPPPQPQQPPPQPSPVRQPPGTPTRGLPASPRMSSPARLNAGMVSRQLSTPQKQVVARSPMRGQGPSPGRPVMQQAGRGRVIMQGGQRVVQQQPTRGRGGQMVVAGRGQVRSLGQPGSVVMGRGGQMMQTVRGRGGVMRGQTVMGGQTMVRQGARMVTPTKTRGGMVTMAAGRGQVVRPMMTRGGVQGRGGVQMIRGGQMVNRPRLASQPVAITQSRRGRPPANTTMMMNQAGRQQPQQQHNSIYVQQQQQRKIAPAPQPRSVSPSSSMVSAVSSWHTPSQNRPVSPPKANNDNFKIKLPKMTGGPSLKKENNIVDLDDDIISLDDPPQLSVKRPNNGHNNLNDALSNRPGLQISRGGAPAANQDEGVDPLSLDDMPRSIKLEKPTNSNNAGNSSNNAIATPDFSSLMDDEISTTGDFRPAGKSNNVSVITGLTSTIKVEGGTMVRPPPVMEGSAKTSSSGKTKDGEWCAVCHDGGDTLYCCDRCPNVYHMFCYIPPLTQEPPDDWVCLMCSTTTEILSLPNKVKKGHGKLSERDLQLSRRLLFEMYNMWPESVPFRDCADLNFPAYLEKIKEPIALDSIKERLDEENPDQYSSVRSFLADLRKMFRNCFTFNSKESEIYKHAKKLEDKLDKLLEVWSPEFVGDPLIDFPVKKGKRPGSSLSSSSKKKKKKKADSDSDEVLSDSDDDASEQERLNKEYLATLHASRVSKKGGDADPDDDDFDPSAEIRGSKGKRGRRGKR